MVPPFPAALSSGDSAEFTNSGVWKQIRRWSVGPTAELQGFQAPRGTPFGAGSSASSSTSPIVITGWKVI